MKGEKEMKQYMNPDFYFIEQPEDLLTVSNQGDLSENVNGIVFDWNNL